MAKYLILFVLMVAWGCGQAYFMFRRFPPKPDREKWASLLIWCIAGVLAALASFTILSGGRHGTEQALLMLIYFLSVGITTEICVQRRARKRLPRADDARHLP